MTSTKLYGKKKIDKIIKAVSDASLITVDSSPRLDSVRTCERIGDSENEVIFASWIDDEGQEFQVIFDEGGLSDAMIDRNRIVAEDNEGEPSVIELFDLVPKMI